LNFQQLYLQLEYAPVSRLSIFAEVPFRFLQPRSFITHFLGSPIPMGFSATGNPGGPPLPNPSGLGDVRAGFKFALSASSTHSLSLQLRTSFSTGNVPLGLGTGHDSVEPLLLYYQKLSDRLKIESEFGDWHPIGGSAGVPTASSRGFANDIFFYGTGPSYEVYRAARVRFAPVVEFFGWHVVSGFQTGPANVDASGTNVVNLKAGARIVIGSFHSIYIGFGQAVTHATWYKNIVRAEYRYSF
jgi:hypothetical protein